MSSWRSTERYEDCMFWKRSVSLSFLGVFLCCVFLVCVFVWGLFRFDFGRHLAFCFSRSLVWPMMNVFVFTTLDLSVSCSIRWLKGERPGTRTLAACSQKNIVGSDALEEEKKSLGRALFEIAFHKKDATWCRRSHCANGASLILFGIFFTLCDISVFILIFLGVPQVHVLICYDCLHPFLFCSIRIFFMNLFLFSSLFCGLETRALRPSVCNAFPTALRGHLALWPVRAWCVIKFNLPLLTDGELPNSCMRKNLWSCGVSIRKNVPNCASIEKDAVCFYADRKTWPLNVPVRCIQTVGVFGVVFVFGKNPNSTRPKVAGCRPCP